MSDWETDVYYNPEKHELETVGTIQWDEPCYSFDITAVWYHRDTGTFYWGSDSGCSCPSPFENVTDKSQLNSGTFHQAAAALQTRHDAYVDDGWTELRSEVGAEIADLIARMREL